VKSSFAISLADHDRHDRHDDHYDHDDHRYGYEWHDRYGGRDHRA
jgi:hypothetical protein